MFRYLLVSLVVALGSAAVLQVTSFSPEIRCYGTSKQGEAKRQVESLIEELIVELTEAENPLNASCRTPNVCIGADFFFEMDDNYYGVVAYIDSKEKLYVRVDDFNDEHVLDFRKTGLAAADLSTFGPFESDSFRMNGKDCKVKFDKIIPRGELNPRTVVNFCTECL